MAQDADALPAYDFWDDSPFDDIRWQSYVGERSTTFAPMISRNMDPDQCVNSCIADENCISFFYHRVKMECEKVKFNIILNYRRDDGRIMQYQGNRLFRYLPPGPEFCSMELCFYYDRKARACWKIISGDGPQRGKYSIVDARSACAKYGARLASVDTIEKINQLNLMLINIPELAPAKIAPSWKTLWVGAKKTGVAQGKPVFTWESGQTVTVENRYWSKRYARLNAAGRRVCVVMAPFKEAKLPPGSGRFEYPTKFKFDAFKCDSSSSLYGMVCEVPPPGDGGN